MNRDTKIMLLEKHRFKNEYQYYVTIYLDRTKHTAHTITGWVLKIDQESNYCTVGKNNIEGDPDHWSYEWFSIDDIVMISERVPKKKKFSPLNWF